MPGTVVVGTLTGRAIQEAIDSLVSGGLVFLQPGMYQISEPIRIGNDVTICGSGSQFSVLSLSAGASCHLLTNRDQDGGNSNISIRALRLEGRRTTQHRAIASNEEYFCCGLFLRKARTVTIQDLVVHDIRENALHFEDCTDILIDRCVASSSGASGIFAYRAQEVVVQQSYVLNSGMDQVRSGIHCDGGSKIYLQAHVNQSSGHGIVLESRRGTLDKVVLDCEATSAIRGLAIIGSHDHPLHDVLVRGQYSENRQVGIMISNATHVFLTNCIVEDNVECGIVLQGKTGAKHCIIAGCRLARNGQHIIETHQSEQNYAVENRIVDPGWVPLPMSRGALPISPPQGPATGPTKRWNEMPAEHRHKETQATGVRGESETYDRFETRCAVCGVEGSFENRHPSIREGYPCENCRASLRYQGQALVILDLFAKAGASAISELAKEEEFRRLSVYEPGVLGPFRSFLRTLDNYQQSAYWPEVERGALRDGLRCEDLMDLTFEDESFDLVITSDIFEHIRQPMKAFEELWRVLKPGGAHVFSIPVLHPMPAKSVARVDTSGVKEVFLLDPIYHGPTKREHLVYTDFGADMIDQLNAIGLETKAVRYERGSEATRRLLTFYSIKA